MLEDKVDQKDLDEAQRIFEEAEGITKILSGWQRWLIPVVAASWSIFQLSISSFVLLEATVIRAVHLAFALFLVFLAHPMFKKPRKYPVLRYLSIRDKITALDFALAIVAAVLALYIVIDYVGISQRQGSPLTRDLFVGFALVILLLEAARRVVGPALTIVASIFIFYGFYGPYMPGPLSFKGVSFNRFIGQLTLSTEGIYGVPLDVSATIVFLFVLFGAMLDKAGAGKYFVDIAFSLLGRFKGGPAKAAVLASGLTGMVSGSSIANTVTTGTFTIPMMKSVGYPPHKAGAVEVACSTNGQLMPPIMGAAAFIIAEYCNVSYVEVIRAAFIPAVASYFALMFITHIEAGKLGLRGMTKEELPLFGKTFIQGLHFLIPLAVLIVELVVYRHSPQLAAFRAIVALTLLIPVQNIAASIYRKKPLEEALKKSVVQIWEALVAGGKNMMGIGVAVAAAGIIVGIVTLGLGGIITEVIEVISGGNLILILLITAFTSLLLGMGLPTTANYIVMASLTAPVIVTLGASAGVVFPLLAAHLFVFFFGILADDTPPVGLAAFAASAIAKSDPIKTGIQGFRYDIRTAVLPFMFIFNTDLLLIGIDSFWYAAWIFFATVIAMFAFVSLVQNFYMVKNRWYEGVLLLTSFMLIMRPYLFADKLGFENQPMVSYIIGLACFFAVYALQRMRNTQEVPA